MAQENQRHFLVTIGAKTQMDVNDAQEAIVEAIAADCPDDKIDYSNVDVKLIEQVGEIRSPVPMGYHQYELRFNKLEES